MNNFEELSNVILETKQNPSKYIALGQNAVAHYNAHRTVPQMAQGFLDAIDYALQTGQR